MTRTPEEAINRLRELPEEEHDAAAAAVSHTSPTTTLPHSRAQQPPHRALNSIVSTRYSITSSARTSSPVGNSIPSALAVLRLITSSNLVGCTTGRSAGFSPLYGAFEVKHLFHAFSSSTSFIPVSLFDLESRFFATTHTCWRPARTGAVKVGRRSGLAARSVVSRPALTAPSTAARWLWSG
jgi:hypothetical protein